jgi:hypothetical protein
MPRFINGPFNYVQLEGNISNIKKNITIFMDVHLDLNNQTRCESFDSQDISQYLYNMIKHANTSLYFFLEIDEKQIKKPQINKRDIYIGDVIEMFKSEFILEKDKVKYSKSNPNVRLHYLDIRDHLNFLPIKNIIDKQIIPRLNILKDDNLDVSTKNNILEQIKQYIEIINKDIFTIIEHKINIQQNKLKKFNAKSREYYLNKIINNYKHKSIKQNINIYFNIFIMTYLTVIHGLIAGINLNIITYKINLNETALLIQLIASCYKLHENIFILYGVITDIYFLRRILDKDYIQNVITYCGRNHALNYIFFLVKYCNFTITKIYDTNGLDIKDIEKKIKDIKETDELDKIYNLFLFEGEKPKQCVEKPNSKFMELGW